MRAKIRPPDKTNYSPQRCEWGFRNPRNHLTIASFYTLISKMAARGDQRIICPGCGRDVYLELKISGHNHNRPLTKKQKEEVERIREENARIYGRGEDDY